MLEAVHAGEAWKSQWWSSIAVIVLRTPYSCTMYVDDELHAPDSPRP